MAGKWIRLIAAALAALGVASPALAQADGWPARSVRVVVPQGAGSGTDIFARMICDQLSVALKQAFVVDNKSGGNGIIGNDLVAKAAPDGYTLLFTNSSSIAINPVLHPRMPYDALKDLVPVAQVGAGGTLLVANPRLGVTTLQQFVQYAKSHPGQLAYGTWGNGSSGHLVMEGIKAAFGLELNHVPYKQTSQVVTDLIAGNILVAFTDIASPLPHIAAGNLVPLGVSGTARGPALPNVPTLSEQGFKFDVDGWFAVFAPAGTPAPVVRRLNEEINRILKLPQTRQRFEAQNMPAPPVKTAEEFAATVKTDFATWMALGRAAKLRID